MIKPILSTHVGSLPRSQSTVDFIFARENNEIYDPSEFQIEMTSAVDAVVPNRLKQVSILCLMVKLQKFHMLPM